jgi:hypothetical protein
MNAKIELAGRGNSGVTLNVVRWEDGWKRREGGGQGVGGKGTDCMGCI